jgi:hypothetical protein
MGKILHLPEPKTKKENLLSLLSETPENPIKIKLIQREHWKSLSLCDKARDIWFRFKYSLFRLL